MLLSLGLLARGKNNGQYDAIYYRYCSLSAGTYLRAPAAKLGSRLALSELLTGAALGCGNGAAILRRAGDHLYEGEHFAGMARVLGLAYVFQPA